MGIREALNLMGKMIISLIKETINFIKAVIKEKRERGVK